MAEAIRLARAGDVAAMAAIELAAGQLFLDVGMPQIAADEPLPPDVLAAYVAAGRAWVAAAPGRAPVGYGLADVVDGCGHLEQVSVDPAHGRRGLGAALVEAVCAWAIARGLPALTLVTFRDVPWNAPYYGRLGFRELADEELGPGLRALRERERGHGLDAAGPRVCMRRELPQCPARQRSPGFASLQSSTGLCPRRPA